jgi:hypothetical protein
MEEYHTTTSSNTSANANANTTPVATHNIMDSHNSMERIEIGMSDFQPQPSPEQREIGEELIEQTAQETINRLIRSGNRPAEISTLKNYILLHNQELSMHGNLEKIIRRMEEKREIAIQGQEVVYNF